MKWINFRPEHGFVNLEHIVRFKRHDLIERENDRPNIFRIRCHGVNGDWWDWVYDEYGEMSRDIDYAKLLDIISHSQEDNS